MAVKDFIVQIQTDLGDGQCAISTGYPVAPGIVLTAYHGLCDGKGKLAEPGSIFCCWPHLPGVVDEPRVIEQIAWESEGLDAALLRVNFPVDQIIFGQLSTAKPVDLAGWFSRGYAAAGRRGKLEDPTDLNGRCYSNSTNDHQFDLSEEAAALTEDWKGASGAPVFASNGEVIIGILRSAKANFDGKRFVATLSAALLEDSEFKKILGENRFVVDGQVLLKRRRTTIEAVLTNNTELCRQVSSELERLNAAPPAIASQSLTSWLLENVPQRVATLALSNTASNAIGANNELAASAQSLLAEVLPGIFGQSGMHAVLQRAQSSTPSLVSLPIGDSSLAEVIMAGADGRKADYRIVGDDNLVGKYQTPAAPESGIEASIYKDIFADLENTFASNARKRATGSESEKHELVSKMIRGGLEDEAQSNRTIYCVLPLSSVGDTSVDADYQRLCKNFPSLICIRIAADNESIEAHGRAMRPVQQYYRDIEKNNDG